MASTVILFIAFAVLLGVGLACEVSKSREKKERDENKKIAREAEEGEQARQ